MQPLPEQSTRQASAAGSTTLRGLLCVCLLGFLCFHQFRLGLEEQLLPLLGDSYSIDYGEALGSGGENNTLRDDAKPSAEEATPVPKKPQQKQNPPLVAAANATSPSTSNKTNSTNSSSNKTNKNSNSKNNNSTQADAKTQATETTPAPKKKRRDPPVASPVKKISAAFVHVGKTGGSTLSGFLANGCHSWVPKPCNVLPNETAISKLSTYYHVPDFHMLPKTKHNAYVITVRDVFTRTVSAFLYHHPENLKYYHVRMNPKMRRQGPIAYKCFPTLESFAGLLQRGNSTDCDYPYTEKDIVIDNCSELACAALHGKVQHFTHLFYSYRHVFERMPLPDAASHRKWYVIRNEHLWDDWFDVNERLGDPSDGPRDPPTYTARNVTGLKLPVTREISDARRDQLCKAVETEYEAYFSILKLADNVDEYDLEEALEVAEKNCPKLDLRIDS